MAPLVAESDGQYHLFRDFDFDGAILGGVLGSSWKVGDGWFILPRAPFTLLRFEVLRDGFGSRHLLEGVAEEHVVEKGLKNVLGALLRFCLNGFFCFQSLMFFDMELSKIKIPNLQEFLIAN